MKEYNVKEVCKILGITIWTLTNWYQWERICLQKGILLERELPVPSKVNTAQGRPRMWTEDQVKELKKFQKTIIKGRNGRMGIVTNSKKRQKKNR